MDTVCVELKFSDGSMISVDSITVDNDISNNMYQRSELDWLLYSKSLEYAQLVLEDDMVHYVRGVPEDRLIDYDG